MPRQRSSAGVLGDAIAGVLCTDQWSAYRNHPVGRSQVCWAHLKRDFQKVVDRPEAGRAGLEAVEGLFGAWHLRGTHFVGRPAAGAAG